MVMSMGCCPVAVCDGPDCLQLTEREAKVCLAICDSKDPVTFSALKAGLGCHQEVVSRILKRLVNHGENREVPGQIPPGKSLITSTARLLQR